MQSNSTEKETNPESGTTPQSLSYTIHAQSELLPDIDSLNQASPSQSQSNLFGSIESPEGHHLSGRFSSAQGQEPIEKEFELEEAESVDKPFHRRHENLT